MATRTANRQNLAKLWQLTRSSLREIGWKVDAGSICELYLRANSRSAAELIWVSPKKEMLLIRVTPRNPSDLNEIRERVATAIATLELPVEVLPASVRRVAGQLDVVDVAFPLTTLLKETKTSAEIEQRLCSYVVPLVRATESVLGTVGRAF